jgi:uncharacterized protein YndB with AHSA1/START domain
MAVDRGALVLADLSGYTRYLTGVELEHSSDVIADLLGTIVAPLDAAGLRLAKLEGDCVFSAGAIDDVGLRTAIETTYRAFRARRRAIALATSCACDACSRIDDLDLKVVAHRGEWITHEVAGSRELTGPDVIVAHRLLKNDVDAGDAYALITGATGDHVEVVDGAEVRGTVVDLEACWQSFEARRPVLVPPADAVFELHTETAASPALVFEVLTAPDHQRRWRVGITAYDVIDDNASRGVGSTAHCVHGRTVIVHEVVDWRPPERYSYKERNPLGPTLWSVELEPSASGTRCTMRMALAGGRRQRLLWPAMKGVLRKKVTENMESMRRYADSISCE